MQPKLSVNNIPLYLPLHLRLHLHLPLPLPLHSSSPNLLRNIPSLSIPLQPGVSLNSPLHNSAITPPGTRIIRHHGSFDGSGRWSHRPDGRLVSVDRERAVSRRSHGQFGAYFLHALGRGGHGPFGRVDVVGGLLGGGLGGLRGVITWVGGRGEKESSVVTAVDT
jgi:hypothetical protein